MMMFLSETECKSSWLITLMTRKVHISKSALIRIDNSSASHRSTREFLLLLRVAGTFNSTACGIKRCRRHCRAGLPRSSTIPNQTPRGWLGKVGKVLQYLDKPAPNQTCWKRVRVVKGVSSRGPADLALSTIRQTLLEKHCNNEVEKRRGVT